MEHYRKLKKDNLGYESFGLKCGIGQEVKKQIILAIVLRMNYSI